MSEHDTPDDVGANTERFEAFVRQGEQLEQQRQGSTTLRIVTLLGGLVVLAALVWLLLR